MLLIGYFEGIDSERGICWRCSDSLSLREFLGLGPTESVPDHSSLCHIRQRLPLEVHHEMFVFVLRILEQANLLNRLLKNYISGSTLQEFQFSSNVESVSCGSA